uniref:Uncharacterized protein n=1 Tax=Anguilla anguilla TaxID=7936 RepID=A0A0E9XLP2_ANGAN
MYCAIYVKPAVKALSSSVKSTWFTSEILISKAMQLHGTNCSNATTKITPKAQFLLFKKIYLVPLQSLPKII